MKKLPLVLLLVACQSERSEAPAPAASSTTSRPAAAPPPSSSAPLPPVFAGPLTVDRVQSAKGTLVAPKPLREALGDLEAKLGPPQKTRTGVTIGPSRTWYDWAATDGKTCATYGAVEQPNMLAGWPSSLVEDHAKSVTMPAHVIDDPSVKNPDTNVAFDWDDFTKCLAALDQTPGLPADDPKGKGPNGPITHAALVRGLYDAPSRWIGKTVAVRGVHESSSGDGITLRATGEKDGEPSLQCKLAANEAAPEAKGTGTITVTATVADPRTNRRVDLVDCRVAHP